jgi:hypothetical protein
MLNKCPGNLEIDMVVKKSKVKVRPRILSIDKNVCEALLIVVICSKISCS